VFIVQKVLRKFGFFVPVFVVMVMLPEPYVKWSICPVCSRGMSLGICRIFRIFLVDGCFVETKVYL